MIRILEYPFSSVRIHPLSLRPHQWIVLFQSTSGTNGLCSHCIYNKIHGPSNCSCNLFKEYYPYGRKLHK